MDALLQTRSLAQLRSLCCTCKVDTSNMIDVTTGQDAETERLRLTALMTTFAAQALAGCPCTHLDEATGERVAAQYRADKSFERLTITSARGSSSVQIVCPIAEIQEIYCTTHDDMTCFPGEVMSTLGRQDAPRLLRVIHGDGRGGQRSFCILVESEADRDAFYECLRILQFYAIAQQGQDGR